MKTVLAMTIGWLLPVTAWGVEASGRDFCKNNFASLESKVKTNPRIAEDWRNYRICVTELKRWHDGEVVAAQALKTSPDLPEAHLLLGVTRLHAKNYTKAAESLDDAIRLKPDNPQAYYYLGMSYLFQNMPLEASKAAERAVELEPGKAANHSQLAYAYYLLDEQEKCEAAAKRAIELDQDNVAAYKVLGNLYQKQGKQAEADLMFEEAIHANGRIASSEPAVTSRKTLPGMKTSGAPPIAAAGAGAAAVAAGIPPRAAPVDPEKPQGKAEVEDFLNRQWRGMKQALIDGQIEKAIPFYSNYADTREKYRASFQRMGPARLKQVFVNMGDLEDCDIVLAAATCSATISSGGTLHVTKVRFERNEDKVWRIRSY